MTNAELAKKQDQLWKAREADREKDQQWKDDIQSMLRRITTTVFDGNGDMSMVKALAAIKTRHDREDEKILIYKTIRKATFIVLPMAGAAAWQILLFIMEWLGR